MFLLFRTVVAALACLSFAFAQRGVGELRLLVRDPSGLPVRAAGELSGTSVGVRTAVRTNSDGRCTLRALPLGSYRLTLQASGFTALEESLSIESEVPLTRDVTLQVAGVQSAVTVSDATVVVDPVSPRNYVGRESIVERRTSAPGWGLLDLVRTQPGWLLEANGVLHPRGSEYETQYVVDGLPMIDNRSPTYAPGVDAEQLQSVTVRTAGYPAEYGRKLGGVVEMVTTAPPGNGVHGYALTQTGSFAATLGSAGVSYTQGRVHLAVNGDSGHTDRYLDPPSLANFSNRGSSRSANGRVEYELGPADRVRVQVSSRRSAFLVPNTDEQEEAGQRQDRRNTETAGNASWTHIVSPSVMLAVRGSVRDLSAALWSNALATPIVADQDRGFREGYASASIAGHQGRHDWKAGTDVLMAAVNERFDYTITRPDAFDNDLPSTYAFAGRKRSREHAVFAQDQVRWGELTLSAGVRWDGYRFVVKDSAWSPRLGLAWHAPKAGLALRASYDRVFQTPAMENLLLASAASSQNLTSETTGLPVPPSRANYWEVGFSKTLGARLRMDGSYYRRSIRDFADDDVFLNTGVSFPVSFRRAQIHGVEVRLELPGWGRFSGLLSYSNLAGVSTLPVTGGLFLESGRALLQSTDTLPITQDQRNTAYGRLRFQATRRLWVAGSGWYGSGLPFEQDAASPEVSDPRILNRVNLQRGRVRPSWSMDASVGADVVKRERSTLTLQADALNVTNQTNVINFNGLFSGTALAAPRSLAVRVGLRF